jgi:hypothetical protein
MSPRLKQACIAFVTAAVAVVVLSLSAVQSHAQKGPFAGYSGSWTGGGVITLASGSREQIKCRATYDAQSGGNGLTMALRCAGDSYNYDFQGTANHDDGKITGNWSEANQQASGRFTGVVNGAQVAARIDLPSVTVALNMTTHGDRQSISIRSPGSQVSDVAIALRRR